MERNHNLSHRLIASVLMSGLFLQSCLNQPISPIIKEGSDQTSNRQVSIKEQFVKLHKVVNTPYTSSYAANSKALIVAEEELETDRDKEFLTNPSIQQQFSNNSKKDLVHESTSQVITKERLEKRTRKAITNIVCSHSNFIKVQPNEEPPYIFKTRQGHQVKVYQQHGKYQADVREKIGIFTGEYVLPVYFEPGITLKQLITLPQPIQEQYLHVILPRPSIQQAGYVYIGKRSILGGMMESNTDKANQDGKKGKESKEEVTKQKKIKRGQQNKDELEKRTKKKPSRKDQEGKKKKKKTVKEKANKEEKAKIERADKKGKDIANKQGGTDKVEKDNKSRKKLTKDTKGPKKVKKKTDKKKDAEFRNKEKNKGEKVGSETEKPENIELEKVSNLEKGEEKEKEKEAEELKSKEEGIEPVVDLSPQPISTCKKIVLQSPPIIPQQEITIHYDKRLGGGGQGIVCQATYQGETVAVKLLNSPNQEAIAAFKLEAMIMSNHHHDNIVAFLGFCPERYVSVMEYVPGGSLWNLLKSSEEISWRYRYQVAVDVAEGMKYLHNCGILHRDLKSENILLDSNGRAKVTDFGLSLLKSERSTFESWDGCSGTIRWMAPEIFCTNKNSKAGDVYSYGMLLWQLGARREPFEKIPNLIALARHIAAGNLEEITEDTPSQIREMIQLCWLPEPLVKKETDTQQRPEMRRVRELLGSIDPAIVEEEYQNLVAALKEEGKRSSDKIQGDPTLIQPNDYPQIEAPEVEINRPALHIAAQNGDLEDVKRLVANGTDINAADGYGWTPLHYAVVADTQDQDVIINIIKLLLANGADINAVDNEYRTPLSYAKQYGRENVAALLTVKEVRIITKRSTKHHPKRQQRKQLIRELPKLHTYIPQARPKHYVPRKDKQEELSQVLKDKGICVVYGYGGAGKSTLVAEYGHNQKAEQTVWWLRAENGDKLITSYQNLAKELEIDYEELLQEFKQESDKYLPELARKVYNVLEDRQQSTLLILDNAIDPMLVSACLLHRPDLIQAIVTTRNKRNFEDYYQIQLDAFTLEQGKTYIQQMLERLKPSEHDIKALIDEIGLIPQKLALATSYIRDIKLMNIEKYIQKLQELKKQHKKQQGQLILPEVNLGLETLDTPSQLIMRYGAYLDPDFIPLSLVSDLLKVNDEEELDTILSGLEKLSLITLTNDPSKAGIQIHREIQTACKAYQDWKEEKTLTEQDLLKLLLQVLDPHMPEISELPDNTWEQAKLYASNVVHALVYATQILGYQSLLADLADRMGEYSGKVQCNYQQALKYHQQALEVKQVLYTANHPNIPKTWNNIGIVYKQLGQYEEALKCYQQALEIHQALHTGNHPDIASSFNNLGSVYQDLGQYEEALRYYEQTFAMREALYISNHPELAKSLINLGNVYKALGQYQEALNYYQQALQMRKTLYTANHPDIAASLNSMGVIYETLGQYEEALKYYQQGLEMRQALYSDNHPSIAASLNNLGDVYKALGQYQEALKYYEQTFQMRKALYSGNHPDIATSINNMGVIYKTLGQYEEALKYYQQGLEMRQALYIGDHPGIASSLNNLAIVYEALDQYEEASKYYQQALQMRRALYPGNHPGIASLLDDLGVFYKALGQYEEALKYYQQGLEMRQALYIGDHPDIATSLNNLAIVYEALDQYEEASKYYQQAFQMRKIVYVDKHPDIAESLNNLGDVYAALGRNQKALKYYIQALQMQETLYTGNHPDIAISLNNLGLVYEKLGQYGEAVKWYQKGADTGDMITQNNLAIMYKNGQGVEQDYQEALKWFQKAADQGDAAAQYSLGIMYKNGQGVEQNYKEALKWYQKAANQGYAAAQNNLGIMYDNGQGVVQDYQEALKWFQKAADQGDAAAQYSLGIMYKNGQGVEQNYKEALKWYQKAANQGYAAAQNNLGIMYDNGQGVVQDYQEALKWFQKAADQGSTAAQNNLGIMYKNGQGMNQNYQEALKWFQKAAHQGYIPAQYNLGIMYRNGKGIDQNYQEALKWIQKAADQGYASAQNSLGWMYQNTLGLVQNHQEALKWYQKAADQGNAAASNNLGFMYENGLYVTEDYQEAVKWYQKSTAQESNYGKGNLGRMYYHGTGIEKNTEEASKLFNEVAKYFKEEAEKGSLDIDGKYILGWMHQHGQGVEQNYQEAVKWYQKAADQRFGAAQFALGIMYENGYGVDKDYTKARDYYQAAANQGYAKAEAKVIEMTKILETSTLN